MIHSIATLSQSNAAILTCLVFSADTRAANVIEAKASSSNSSALKSRQRSWVRRWQWCRQWSRWFRRLGSRLQSWSWYRQWSRKLCRFRQCLYTLSLTAHEPPTTKRFTNSTGFSLGNTRAQSIITTFIRAAEVVVPSFIET